MSKPEERAAEAAKDTTRGLTPEIANEKRDLGVAKAPAAETTTEVPTGVMTAQERALKETKEEIAKAEAKQKEEDEKALERHKRPLCKLTGSGPDQVIRCNGDKVHHITSAGELVGDKKGGKVLGAFARIGGPLREGEVVQGLRLAIQRPNQRVVYSGPVVGVAEFKEPAQ